MTRTGGGRGRGFRDEWIRHQGQKDEASGKRDEGKGAGLYSHRSPPVLAGRQRCTRRRGKVCLHRRLSVNILDERGQEGAGGRGIRGEGGVDEGGGRARCPLPSLAACCLQLAQQMGGMGVAVGDEEDVADVDPDGALPGRGRTGSRRPALPSCCRRPGRAARHGR